MNEKMKILLKLSASLPLLAFAAVFVLAQPPRVSSSLDKNAVHVGDVIHYKIKAELPENAYFLPEKNIVFKDFDTLNISAAHISERPNVYEIDFEIAAYSAGSFEIEPVGLSYVDKDGKRKMFFTPAANVFIESVLSAGQKDIMDIKPIKKAGMNKKNAALALLFFLLAAVFMFFTARDISGKRVKKRAQSDPRLQALFELDELLKSGSFKSGNSRLFYYKAAEILRRYISCKCGFNAMEMTSAELLGKFEAEGFVSMTKNELKDYFHIFDLARYAGLKAGEREMSASLEKTKEFVTKL